MKTKLRVVEAEALKSEDGVLSSELAAIQGRLGMPVDVGFDRVDEVQFINNFRKFRHALGDDEALVEVVDPVVDLMDAGVGATVDHDGGVEDAAVGHHDSDDAALLRPVSRLSLRLRDGLLLLLFLGGLGLRLLLGGLLFGLLLDLGGLLFLLLLLLHSSRRRLSVVVIVVVAAADQRQPGCTNAGASARLQQSTPRDPISAHTSPIVSLGHSQPLPNGPHEGISNACLPSARSMPIPTQAFNQRVVVAA